MTADIELLPLPEPAAGYGRGCNIELSDGQPLYTAEQVSACVAHATAAKDDEIERLRAEVGRWRTEATEVANGAAVAIEQAEARAERRTEAINAYKSECDNPAKDYVLRAKRRDEMFALLREQEGGNG